MRILPFVQRISIGPISYIQDFNRSPGENLLCWAFIFDRAMLMYLAVIACVL